MKIKAFLWLAQIAAFAAVAGVAAPAQSRGPVKLSGTINDYTSSGQIWEMRGVWSLKIDRDSDTADFEAALNMEHSDIAVLGGATRTPHTHHITLKDAQLISDPAIVKSTCPTANAPYSPLTTTGFVITGMASTTGNGANAPFAPQGQQSLLTVCVTGSDQVAFSNITLVFPATLPDGITKNPAAGHFGTQPIDGVVKRVTRSRDGDD